MAVLNVECDVTVVVVLPVSGRPATVVLGQMVVAAAGADGDLNGYIVHQVVDAVVVVEFVAAAAKLAAVVVAVLVLAVVVVVDR